MKITHQSIYKISKDRIFDNVNSYKEMNDIISTIDSDNYKGDIFEVFTQFFCVKYNNDPLLGIKNIQDTSDDPFNVGYDFTFINFNDENGMIQSKWRSNPKHQFTLGELATNSAIAGDMDITK